MATNALGAQAEPLLDFPRTTALGAQAEPLLDFPRTNALGAQSDFILSFVTYVFDALTMSGD